LSSRGHPRKFKKKKKKEAYMSAGGDASNQEHPMLEVRSRYAGMMEESREIVKRRRSGKPVQLDAED
jgi:hypothetical protein